VKFPSGWSQANLNRHAPSKFELAVARIGREAAAQFRRKVHTTRRGLAVGQFYLFDDLEYDKKVNFPGNRIATKPLGLCGLDLFSACFIALGFKPTLIDIEGAKKNCANATCSGWSLIPFASKGFRTDERGTTLSSSTAPPPSAPISNNASSLPPAAKSPSIAPAFPANICPAFSMAHPKAIRASKPPWKACSTSFTTKALRSLATPAWIALMLPPKTSAWNVTTRN
jgi:hypothetical protein